MEITTKLQKRKARAMARFLSFLVDEGGDLYYGIMLHNYYGIINGHSLNRRDVRRAQWTGHNPDTLRVRVRPGETEQDWKDMITSNYPTRSDLLAGRINGKGPNNSYATYRNGKRHSYNDNPSIVYPDGSYKYHIRGKPGRTKDEPTYFGTDGTKMYYNPDGKLSRGNNKPAIRRPEGFEMYYTNGVITRSGAAAIISPDGTRLFYTDGEPGRPGDLPTIVWYNGLREFYTNGKLSRPDPHNRPARIFPGGRREYYDNGVFIKAIDP